MTREASREAKRPRTGDTTVRPDEPAVGGPVDTSSTSRAFCRGPRAGGRTESPGGLQVDSHSSSTSRTAGRIIPIGRPGQSSAMSGGAG